MGRSIRGSFDISLKILSTLRLYPSHKSKKLNRIQAYSAFILALPLIILNFLYFLFGEPMDQTQINFNMIVLAEDIGFIPKLLSLIGRETEIKKCVHYFDTFHFAMSEDDSEMITKNCIKACRRNSKLILSLLTAVLISFIFKPMILPDYMLPIEIWLPFDIKSGYMYYHVYIYQVIAGSYWVFAGVMIDPLIGGLIYQAASQLVVLQMYMQNLCKYSKEAISKIDLDSNQKSEVLNIIVYSKIKECVRYYDAILRFIESIGECFSFAVFGQLASSGVVFCFSCLQLSMASSVLNFETLLSLTCSVTVLGQIYFYCYYAALLYEENKKVIDAVYSCEWYEFDIKSKKALLIMMERAKKPMILTAGKIIELSLDTFATVIKRSYSLLAVLKSYQ